MIKLEHTVLPSPEQMQFIIEGMRNPMNSWEKSDSVVCGCNDYMCSCCEENHTEQCSNGFVLGDNDHSLMQRLSNAGTDHRKFMRMMPVFVRIIAPLYWWKEADTYKIGTVANSCSTMHKIQEKEFTMDDFSIEHLDDDRRAKVSNVEWLEHLIHHLNRDRRRFIETKEKQYWWQMIQLLPSSYNQTRNVMLNYEVLANMYHSRKNHTLDEWREFCKWIENLPYSELIIGEEVVSSVDNFDVRR